MWSLQLIQYLPKCHIHEQPDLHSPKAEASPSPPPPIPVTLPPPVSPLQGICPPEVTVWVAHLPSLSTNSAAPMEAEELLVLLCSLSSDD